MDERSAEMTKYAANSFLATKISFMNEMAVLCDRLGVDVDNVRIGIGSDSRIGYAFIYPVCGYGGSCFPKDVKSLVKMAEKSALVRQALIDRLSRLNAEKDLIKDIAITLIFTRQVYSD